MHARKRAAIRVINLMMGFGSLADENRVGNSCHILDTADKSQSSRHIPCAVHLESWQKLDGGRHGGACLLLLCGRHGGACLLLLSDVSKLMSDRESQ
jgi:hypothetical protein